MEENIQEKVLSLLSGIKEKEWHQMVNDIERYQKIKDLILNGFRATLPICPKQIRVVIGDKIQRMEEQGYIFEFVELEEFLKLSSIFATSLVGELDNKNIKDFAIPYKIMGVVDDLTRVIEKEQFSEENLSKLGSIISTKFEILKARLSKTDWTEGWEK